MSKTRDELVAHVGEVLGVVRDLRDATGRAVVPFWFLPAAAVLVATLVVIASHIDFAELFRAWLRNSGRAAPVDEAGPGVTVTSGEPLPASPHEESLG